MRHLLLISLLCIFADVSAQQESPKNIIVFIADGGGYNQMMCTDYFLYGKTPSSPMLHFPVQLSMSTYNGSLERKGATCYNSRLFWTDFNYGITGYTESAASATAMGTGFKTENGRIGYNLEGEPSVNLAEIARSIGKKTGVVTSVPFNHATPAGFSVHAISRHGYLDLASQMIHSQTLDIIGGAGHPWFNDSGKKLDSAVYKNLTPFSYNWLIDSKNTQWSFTDQRNQIRQWASMNGSKTPERLFMLAPVASTFAQNREGISQNPFDIPLSANIPTLAEMSLAALNAMKDDPDGFFLMIEGGAIDWANHNNELPRLIEEYAAFYNTVDSVMQYLEKHNMLNNTLVIVTSDHECGYLWGPPADDFKYTNPVNNGKGVLPSAQYYSTDHSNTLVPFFATGPNAEMFYHFADETDSVRGPYLTNSEIAIAIKMLWGTNAYIFEPNPLQNDTVVLQVALPCPNATIQWCVNDKAIEGQNAMQFSFKTGVYKPDDAFSCKIYCGGSLIRTASYKTVVE